MNGIKMIPKITQPGNLAAKVTIIPIIWMIAIQIQKSFQKFFDVGSFLPKKIGTSQAKLIAEIVQPERNINTIKKTANPTGVFE